MKTNSVRPILALLFKSAAFAALAFMVYCIWAGFPVAVGPMTLKIKNLKPIFTIFLSSALLSAWFSANSGREGMASLKNKVEAWTSRPEALWVLFGLSAIFLTWQQVTEYLSLNVNFLPFSFFDYMIYYYFHGKIHYTGLLHTFYHINNIMFVFAPVWALFKSPLVLTLAYGPLAALAVFPLASIVRKRFGGNTSVAWFISFIYLNYRYLQNVLQMNFCVEIFYPLFIFAAVSMALSRRWGFYFLFVLLGLSVKEDSFLYFGAVGMLVFFMGNRAQGIATGVLAVSYYIFITKFFIPWTGNTVLKENFHNFGSHISSGGELIREYLTQPDRVLKIFVGEPAKIRTYFNLLSRVAFLPLFTPASLLILVPIFPVFAHSTGSDVDFYDLHFHYAAAVVPFVFVAMVFGFSGLYRRLPAHFREKFVWLALLTMLFINGGHFRTESFNSEDLKSIRWAKELPAGAIVLTHGHLLPYIGYREYNFYLAEPFELTYHAAHKQYVNADYVLIDRHVNSYPWDKGKIEQKLADYKNNAEYELVVTDGTRTLFKRKNSDADGKNG